MYQKMYTQNGTEISVLKHNVETMIARGWSLKKPEAGSAGKSSTKKEEG